MDLLAWHDDLIRATHSGFTFLLANGLGWIAIGMIALRSSVEKTALALLLIGLVTMPLAFALRSWLGFPDYTPDNPLNRLGFLLAFSPAVAIPAVIIAYIKIPLYMPSVVAALLGGHFLPYAWLYQTDVYLVLGVVVAAAPGLLMWILGERGFAMGPFLVGGALIVAAALVY